MLLSFFPTFKLSFLVLVYFHLEILFFMMFIRIYEFFYLFLSDLIRLSSVLYFYSLVTLLLPPFFHSLPQLHLRSCDMHLSSQYSPFHLHIRSFFVSSKTFRPTPRLYYPFTPVHLNITPFSTLVLLYWTRERINGYIGTENLPPLQ